MFFYFFIQQLPPPPLHLFDEIDYSGYVVALVLRNTLHQTLTAFRFTFAADRFVRWQSGCGEKMIYYLYFGVHQTRLRFSCCCCSFSIYREAFYAHATFHAFME